ncbi:hypothetical protein BGX28_010411 [Mortierella sp. GBA30]|nr:hypothetical protein BGX28_010411 [Mortierella sp. GBA30]
MSLATPSIDDYPIVIGIDFGTTFSGCAYAHVKERHPHNQSVWPMMTGGYTKAPSVNLYQDNENGGNMVAWGWKALQEEKSSSKSILLGKYKPYLDETFASSQPWKGHIPVLEAISDYLRAFHDYIVRTMQRRMSAYHQGQFRYSLTVPAMWSDESKDTMRRAAIRAGLIGEGDIPDRLMLVSEPEAAALYCEQMCPHYKFQHGGKFLICDAGGGTVDLISYKVDISPEGRTLSEQTKGHGAMCGSIFIDKNFRDLVIQKFRSQGQTLSDEVVSSLVQQFAYYVKPTFEGDNDLIIRFAHSESLFQIMSEINGEAIGINAEDGAMTFKAEEVREILFDPVVEQVLQLIGEQLDKTKDCSAIFLVGGFGSSQYLWNRVSKQFGRRVTCTVNFYFGMNEIQVEAIARERFSSPDGSEPAEKAYSVRLSFDSHGVNGQRRIGYGDTHEE